MNLYTELMGHHPKMDEFLKLYGIDPAKVLRLRDIFLTPIEGDPHGDVCFGVLARSEVNPEITNHTMYLSTSKMSTDGTYFSFILDVPRKLMSTFVAEFARDKERQLHPMERYQILIKKMQAGDMSDPEVKRAVEIGKKILEPTIKAAAAAAAKGQLFVTGVFDEDHPTLGAKK